MTATFLAAVASAQPIQAQQSVRAAERAARAAEARARIDAIRPMAIEAHKAWSEANQLRRQRKIDDEVRLAAALVETFEVGPVQVTAPKGQTERALPYFQRAWAYYQPLLGRELEPGLRPLKVGYRYGDAVLPLLPSGTPVVTETAWWTDKKVEAAARRAIADRLSGIAADQTKALAVSPLLENADGSYEAVYREMATSVSPTVRQCLEGDLGSCWSAVGASEGTDPAADARAWYPDPWTLFTVATARSGDAVNCDPRGTNALRCESFLVAYRDELIPISRASRGSLAAVAVEMGGEGAIGRYLEPLPITIQLREVRAREAAYIAARSAEVGPQQAMQEMLDQRFKGTTPTPANSNLRALVAQTAGIDPDRVMAEWQSRVVAAKPDRPSTDTAARFGALVWVLFLGAFATRSTRWRLG